MNGHILIVDDDADVRRVLRLLLEDAGYTVSEIPDGRLAVAQAGRLRPDLILIDWVMPELDGCAATAQLKRNPETAEIPIVMLSAKLSAADKVDALAAGVAEFVDKPFHRIDVLAKVREQLELRRAPKPDAPPAETAPGSRLDLDALTANAGAAATRKEYAAAAAAYSLAAETAGTAGDSETANTLLRLAGKMELLRAETSSAPLLVHDAYRAAARYLLAAGDFSLATKANAAAKAAFTREPPR
jgi:DNA-binding response OmpR family regulator